MREKNPGNLGIAMLIAALYEQKGDYGKAKDIYEEVLNRNPKSAVAANNLAFYYAEHEPTKEGLAKAEKLILPVLERHKDVPNVVDTVAWIYYRKGEFERARALLMEVEDKGKNVPEINYHLGMINLKLGEKQKAKSYLKLATDSDRNFSGKEEAQRTLKELMMGG
jgi:tetratricopeptide (TPR) repeat protein